MNPLAEILFRNQGQMLTPELIWGIIKAQEFAEPEQVFTGMPTGIRPDDPLPHNDPRLVTSDRERVIQWVSERIGCSSNWGECAGIGLLDKPGGELVAAGLLNNLSKTNAHVHVAVSSKYALKRVLILAFFDYAFNQLGLQRITGLVDDSNKEALKLDQHLGFVHEFTIPNGNDGDVHQLVMWRDQCRWIRKGA